MMDPSAPILFFDSGVGGLSVLGPTRELLPNAPIVYAADSAGFPYGKRSEAEIASRVPALLGRLVERFHPRLAVIACNTASTIALDHVRSALDLPVVGTVPAIKPAAEMSKSRVIGVLGTEATVRQPYVDDLAARFAADCTIIRHGSPELVELAEAKLGGERDRRRGGPRRLLSRCSTRQAASGSTPSSSPAPISRCSKTSCARPFRSVAYVHGGAGIARRIAYLTREQPWPATPSPGLMLFTRQPASPRWPRLRISASARFKRCNPGLIASRSQWNCAESGS